MQTIQSTRNLLISSSPMWNPAMIRTTLSRLTTLLSNLHNGLPIFGTLTPQDTLRRIPPSLHHLRSNQTITQPNDNVSLSNVTPLLSARSSCPPVHQARYTYANALLVSQDYTVAGPSLSVKAMIVMLPSAEPSVSIYKNLLLSVTKHLNPNPSLCFDLPNSLLPLGNCTLQTLSNELKRPVQRS